MSADTGAIFIGLREVVSADRHQTAIANLQNATKYISSGTDVNGYPATFITGCNVWVQSGSGHTDDGGNLTHLGNLILGYNEIGNSNGDKRTGSHNLIVGEENNYESYAGAVFGANNNITSPYASVLGGESNTASGAYTAVVAGNGNVASGEWASILGGYNNQSTGVYSIVAGGDGNVASFELTSILGGLLNAASGEYSSISGGNSNKTTGQYSSILGGANQTVSSSTGHYP